MYHVKVMRAYLNNIIQPLKRIVDGQIQLCVNDLAATDEDFGEREDGVGVLQQSELAGDLYGRQSYGEVRHVVAVCKIVGLGC